MITQQLLDYIAQEIQGGVSPDAIKATLRSNGWIEADIEQAFRASTPAPQIIVPPVQVVQPAKTEFFIPSEKKKFPAIKILLIVVGLLLVAGVAYAGFVFTSSPSLEVTAPTTTTTNPIPEPLPVASSTPEIPLTIATTTATSTPSLALATSTASTTPTSSTSTKAR